MTAHTSLFNYGFSTGALTDVGRKRKTNQDETLVCQETGFFAVSDGMGGLRCGGKTSQMIQQLLPDMIGKASNGLTKESSPELAAEILSEQTRLLSDSIYNTGNQHNMFDYGATLSGVWLIGNHAIFVNIGDSRGYLLLRNNSDITQITMDHNEAARLVQEGKIEKNESIYRWASSYLTQFMGMDPPAMPETFIKEVYSGDILLLCSDGLHGMMDDSLFPSILRSSENPQKICENLVEKANTLGGDDNIAVVYIKIE